MKSDVLISANGESSRIKDFLFTDKLNIYFKGEPVLHWFADMGMCNNVGRVFLVTNAETLAGISYDIPRTIIPLVMPKTRTRIETVKYAMLNIADLSRAVIILDCDVIQSDVSIEKLHIDSLLISEAPKEIGQYGYVEPSTTDGRMISFSEKVEPKSHIYVGASCVDKENFLATRFRSDSILHYHLEHGSVCIAAEKYYNVGDIKSLINSSK